jgi:ABC-type transport system substrate-binding protein
VLAWGCGAQVTPLPSAPRSPASPTTRTPSAATASPSPTFADTLRIGWNPGINGSDIPFAWFGFRDATSALVAMATCDQAARAGLYRQVQQELAAQLPYVFLRAANGFGVVCSTVATVDGPLDLTAPNWAWQPERLVARNSGT